MDVKILVKKQIIIKPNIHYDREMGFVIKARPSNLRLPPICDQWCQYLPTTLVSPTTLEGSYRDRIANMYIIQQWLLKAWDQSEKCYQGLRPTQQGPLLPAICTLSWYRHTPTYPCNINCTFKLKASTALEVSAMQIELQICIGCHDACANIALSQLHLQKKIQVQAHERSNFRISEGKWVLSSKGESEQRSCSQVEESHFQ